MSTVASDNPFPSVLVVEGTTPATPASNHHRVFVDTADDHLKRVDSTGTVTDIEAASGLTALTGDVAASGSGSQAATIANDAVSNAKAANMAQATIKGRAAAAGTGDPTDLTPNQASTILDTATDPFLRTSAVGAGTGDVTGQASSVDSEIALFSGTGGKTIKRATGTGFVKVTSGVIGTPAAQISLTADVTGVLPIANIATGTPNGAKFVRDDGTLATPAGSGTVTHTGGALTANRIVLGAGTDDTTVLASLGTTTTLLHGNAGGAPTFGAVSLTADVTGVLPIANIATGTPTGAKFVRDDGTLAVPSGGTGNLTNTTAVGSEPGSPSAGDLDFYSNGVSLTRYSGSAWTPWGPIFPFTAPVDGSFAWINQGGASVDTTNGGIYLLAPASASTNLRIRKKSAPATPYTITAAIAPFMYGVANQAIGLAFRQSSDGKLAVLALFSNATQFGLASYKYTSATAFSASYVNNLMVWGNVIFLRITDNGTNRICSYSNDGQHFITIHTVGRTDFLTADEVGFFADTETASFASAINLLSWKET